MHRTQLLRYPIGFIMLMLTLIQAWVLEDATSSLSSDERGVTVSGVRVLVQMLVHLLISPLDYGLIGIPICGGALLLLAGSITSLVIVWRWRGRAITIWLDGAFVGLALLVMTSWLYVLLLIHLQFKVVIYVAAFQYTDILPRFWLVPGVVLIACLICFLPGILSVIKSVFLSED